MNTVPGEEAAASDKCSNFAPKVSEKKTLADFVSAISEVIGGSEEAIAIVSGEHETGSVFVGPKAEVTDNGAKTLVGMNSGN